MNFKGHITGGATAGIFVVAAASAITQPSPIMQLYLFLVTVFFSLFPDFDISSIPQRWFFRAIFALLIYLGFHGNYQLATMIAVLAITPVLSHHRGWTHSYWAALLTPIALAIFYEYMLAKPSSIDKLSFDKVQGHLATHAWFVIACISGWSTHLILDNKFPSLRNHK